MVDVIKSLDFEYVAANPGSSFRGIHESIVNYGGNTAPEFITCCHEESSVAMAHGYFKAEGKPMAVLCHGTVGMQHAAMAIYNAYCDRVPVYIMAGNTLDATLRRPGVEWAHSVQDAAAMVRDFIKWDDLPISLPHFAESAVRAYKIAMTPPMMPVLLVVDGGLQEDPIAPRSARAFACRGSRAPRLRKATRVPVAEAAKLLVAAQNPVIVADRAARTPAGVARLIELAETLQAPVVNQGGRMNFPTRHPLNQSANARQLVANADVIIGLELTDFWGTVNASRDSLVRTSRSVVKPGTKTDQHHRARSRDERQLSGLQRYPEVDIAMAADAEATLPALTEACKRLSPPIAARVCRSGETARRGALPGAGACPRGSRLRVGRHADQHRPPDDGAVGADQERGLGARGRERHHERLDLAAAGPSRSTTSRSAARAAPASATARRRRSARRWPTRSADGCR
jgi:thiamine pyrophosphate-dependent acetolactate synthase large subunit-like protein